MSTAEQLTGGWTDAQIRNKTEAEIQHLLDQNQNVLSTLRNSVREQAGRVNDLQDILARKRAIGGQ